MKKLEITLKIQSTDSKQEFTVIGEYKNNRIKFIDPEGNKNYIVFHKDTVEYFKKGNVDMKFKFNTNEITKGFYTVSNFQFVFDIDTEVITKNDNYLQVKYSLYQENELENETVLELEYSVLEEE